jgi:hypothetical protein
MHPDMNLWSLLDFGRKWANDTHYEHSQRMLRHESYWHLVREEAEGPREVQEVQEKVERVKKPVEPTEPTVVHAASTTAAKPTTICGSRRVPVATRLELRPNTAMPRLLPNRRFDSNAGEPPSTEPLQKRTWNPICSI